VDDTLSEPRLRLAMVAGRSLRLDEARLALVGAAWMQQLSGEVVASNENPIAIDDLEWLDIEVDAMVSTVKPNQIQEMVDKLVADGKAYVCYCSSAEEREMRPNPSGDPEDAFYDNRHRLLTDDQRKAMKKSGRVPSVRLIEDSPGTPWTDLRGESLGAHPPHDFLIVGRDKQPTEAMKRAVEFVRGNATHLVLDAGCASMAGQMLTILEALGSLPTAVLAVPGWPPVGTEAPSLGELQASGYLPHPLRDELAATIWGPDVSLDKLDVDSVTAPSGQEEPWTLDGMAERHGAALRDMPIPELASALVAYLTTRGFPIMEREYTWQQRFARRVRSSARILQDAEPLASIILTSTVDHDRSATMLLRRPESQDLIGVVEQILDEQAEVEEPNWREVVRDLRQRVDRPGRAMSTLRLILSGQKEGPSLPTVLDLLGVEGCRSRLEKARRYA